MGDLISKKALISALENTPIRLAIDKGEMFRMIEEAPTIDAVEVVRCKYCKWWHDWTCTNINGADSVVLNGDWFCCAGERKAE